MNIAYPFRFNAQGRTAAASDDDHVRDLIEQLLFTNAGDRVNRPDFGAGIQQMLFAPNNPELAAALQFTVQASLQRWLGDIIEIQQVTMTALDSTLRILIQYVVRGTGRRTDALFVREI